MASFRSADSILATWRQVERELAEAEPGSASFERLASDAAKLRDEYQLLVEDAQREQAEPEPQPSA